MQWCNLFLCFRMMMRPAEDFHIHIHKEIYIYMRIYRYIDTSFSRLKKEKIQQSDVHSSYRIASFGIMGDQLRAHMNPLEHHGTITIKGSKVALNFSPILPRDFLLSNRRCNILPMRLICRLTQEKVVAAFVANRCSMKRFLTRTRKNRRRA